jgi:hypothetical protein
MTASTTTAHTAEREASDAERKRFESLRAALALRGGHQVHKVDTGYLVCWQGYARHCSDMESLEAFARHVGAVR